MLLNDKYVILDDVGDWYLVGFESGRFGHLNKEFDAQSAINLRSDWSLVVIDNDQSKTLNFATDHFGQVSYDIMRFLGRNIGITFRGAYIPERKAWVYVQGSYRNLRT